MSGDLKQQARAAAAGQAEWGTWGSTEHLRYVQPAPSTSRRRCSCGCQQRATHVGCANGVALSMGCELSMHRWVKQP